MKKSKTELKTELKSEINKIQLANESNEILDNSKYKTWLYEYGNRSDPECYDDVIYLYIILIFINYLSFFLNIFFF